MNQIEVATKWKPASEPGLAQGFVYICENSRELWRAALWEGRPAPSDGPLSLICDVFKVSGRCVRLLMYYHTTN